MTLVVDRDYIQTTLRGLVQIPSVNPAFDDGRGNEVAVADHLTRRMEALGMTVTRVAPDPARPSVLGRRPGTGGGPSLLLYGHLDTVGVEGMAEPFAARVREGRLYGRGAYDMKGGLTACLAVVHGLCRSGTVLSGDLLIAGVADEEVASLGMSNVLAEFVPDAAIVTEATHLRLCTAHKGFCWIAVETRGRAAHGSMFTEGIDANMRMGRFLGRLEVLERRLRNSAPHPLLGPPSLHAAVLRGGTGTSTYAANCRLEIERRTLPGETEEQIVGEIEALLDELRAEDPTFQATVAPFLTRPPFQALPLGTIADAVARAGQTILGRTLEVIGEPYWMDAALLAERGVDTVVIGPTGAGAHAIEEWVELDSVVQLAGVLARAAGDYCGDARSSRRS